MKLMDLIFHELKALVLNPVIALTVFGGTVFYSFLYPLPYQQQIPRDLPIAVVNLDASQLSYKLERMVDASPNVKVVERLHSIDSAKRQFMQDKITGFVVIPEHFYKDVLLGKAPVLSYAGNASLLLVYGTVVEGLAQAGGTLAAEAKVAKYLQQGVPLVLASEQYSAVKLNSKPTFNPRMGYIDYIVPAVFVLILQQTLLIAAGLLGATQKNQTGYWNQVSRFELITVRMALLSAVYYLLGMYYFGWSFSLHGVSVYAHIGQLLALMLPFFLCTIAIGIWLGNIASKREYVTTLVLMSSMPLLFISGVVWPTEALPQPLVLFAQLLPTAPAINGFLKLNQMAADWWQVAPLWRQLWIQCLVWSAIAYLTYPKTSRSKHKKVPLAN
ncbi:ABC transporter permease [Vibrio hippocampi]|uniref:ABC-2 type transporter transmembrane domain-containing protein n=1 Tax=Vibrio hippocampi TaxID=654686 RepID=A0ABM8ZH75_9VIBR|nr:ABC transporter permease [Vibrio hippocampi]CAH0526042.1 hypothetical protein VHP8226_01528 [Vibrio hippocampi]